MKKSALYLTTPILKTTSYYDNIDLLIIDSNDFIGIQLHHQHLKQHRYIDTFSPL